MARFSFLTLMFVAMTTCFVNSQNVPGANSAEPVTYAVALKAAKEHWTKAKQRHVIVDWNPKAPGLANLKMEVLTDVDDDRLVIYSYPPTSDQRYVAHFNEAGAVVADCQLRTVAKMPPFEPKDNAGTTGLPAELLAVRLLVMANAVPTFRTFDLTEPLRLSRDEEQFLGNAIYAAQLNFSPVGQRRSVLQSTVNKEGVKYEWLDEGGAIFRLETKTCDEAILTTQQKEVRWIEERGKALPIPRMSQLVEHLTEAKVIDNVEGEAVAFGKNGPRTSASLRDGEAFSMEMARIKAAKQIGHINISRACPLRLKQVVEIKDKGAESIGRSAIVVDVEHSKVLCLDGQDWLVTVYFPGMNAGDVAAAKLVHEVEHWLRQLMAGR